MVLFGALLRAPAGFNFGFGLLLFAGSLFFACGGGWRFEPEIAAQFAFRGLAAPHRFGDQLVGQDQPRVRDILHGQHDIGIFAGAHVIAMQPHRIALDACQRAAESLAALMRHRHLDLHEMAGIALEIGAAHQRPVDPGRGNLQPVGAVDRIGDVEHRRQRPRNRLAILDLHRSVGPFRHDLHGAAEFPGDLDPHQPVAHALQDRRGDRRHPRRHAGFDHQARLGKQIGIHGTSDRIGHVQRQNRSYFALGWPGLAAVRRGYPNCTRRDHPRRLVQVIKKSGSRGAHSQYAIV